MARQKSRVWNWKQEKKNGFKFRRPIYSGRVAEILGNRHEETFHNPYVKGKI